jgi:transposase InsO family protein
LKALFEKKNDYSIKLLRTDRGGEFCSNRFYKAQVMKRLLTVPRSLQQNSVVERKNRRILNMMRSMLKTKKMPKKFWVEDVDYVFNCQIGILRKA